MMSRKTGKEYPFDDTESEGLVTGDNVTKPGDNRHHPIMGKIWVWCMISVIKPPLALSMGLLRVE
jgi:hypothetical protein